MQRFLVYMLPTLQAEPAEKEKFYSELRILPQGTPADDKLLVLQRQQALTAGVLHGATTCHHQHHLSTKGQSGDNLDAPSV